MRLIKYSLLSLLLFFATDLYSQQFYIFQSFNNLKTDSIETKPLFKKYPIKINLKKDKIKSLEENFYKLGLPFYEELNLLIRAYHDFNLIYQDLKRLQKSFTSYSLFQNHNLESRLYIVNPRNLKNIKDYEIILEIKISSF